MCFIIAVLFGYRIKVFTQYEEKQSDNACHHKHMPVADENPLQHLRQSTYQY